MKSLLLIPIILSIALIPAFAQVTDNEPTQIPNWIKNNAGWWAEGAIDDEAFVQGIQFLINNNFLTGEIPDKSIDSLKPITTKWINGDATQEEWLTNVQQWITDEPVEITIDDLLKRIEYLELLTIPDYTKEPIILDFQHNIENNLLSMNYTVQVFYPRSYSVLELIDSGETKRVGMGNVNSMGITTISFSPMNFTSWDKGVANVEISDKNNQVIYQDTIDLS